MLTELALHNFKGFGEHSSPTRLARITLVLGKNSAGKSALLQAPLLLAQSLRQLERTIELNGAFVEMGSFREVINRHDLRRRLSIVVEYTTRRGRFPGEEVPEAYREGNRYRTLLTLSFSKRTQKVVINELRHTTLDSGHYARRFRGSHRFNGALGRHGTDSATFPISDSDDFVSVNGDRRPTFARQKEETPAQQTFRSASLYYGRVWQSEIRNIDYIPPAREPGRRYYLNTSSSPELGDFSGRSIATDISLLERRDPETLDRMAEWLRRFDIADNVLPRQLAEGLVSLRLRDAVTGVENNVADFGFGTSQVLPLVIYAATNVRNTFGRTLVVQQPEVHLHPAAQAELGDLFLSLAADGVQSIIETHSEHLVRRLQRRVLEGVLKPDDLAIVFVQKTAIGSTATEIVLDDQGRVTGDIPVGFLDTAYAEAMEFESSLTKKWRHDAASD